MKKFLVIMVLLIVVFTLINGCVQTSCENIKQKEAVMLLDVSDPKLFGVIESDLTQNFPAFMERTGLGIIKKCQSFKMSFAHLSSREDLELSSASIAVVQRNQSIKEERRQSNPAPLVQLMQQKLKEYQTSSEDPEMTKRSNIINVLFKAIVHSNMETETTIMLFSDMVENNDLINLYKKIPVSKDIPGLTEKLIEPDVLKKFRLLQDAGFAPRIIIVLKPEPSGKTSIRDIKKFWSIFFGQLKLDVQFIDNLTNSVDL